MKDLVLGSIHEEMGGKMVEFAGYKMPVQFAGLKIEHKNVREKLGAFDVSHMGEFWVKGPKAFELVQRISSNDVARLFDGKIQYSCILNDKGGIVDDFLVYRKNEETYMLVVNASNIDKDWAWLEKQNIHGADISNVSEATSLIAVQGPLALKAMQKLTDTTIEDMEYYTFKTITFAGVENILLSTTGYTGAGGCEIYIPNENAVEVYKAIMEAGEEFGIMPIGLGARDTLRLEMGFCLYGNDINDTTSPIEAGLGWVTKFVDGNDFTMRAYHEKIKADKPEMLLRAFEMVDKGVPRQHYEICDAEGNNIGEVTSGTMSPSLDKAIGMGYIKKGHRKLGDEIFIKIRKKLVKAVIVKLPFYKG